jgi:sulfur relay protein TusB/DsrH
MFFLDNRPNNIIKGVHMTNICLLISKTPHSDERAELMCGISQRAKKRDMNVTVYFIGDGVLCTKKNQKGYVGRNMKNALDNGVLLKVSAKDLKARAILENQVEPGIKIIDDLEGEFVDDVMEHADRVITW